MPAVQLAIRNGTAPPRVVEIDGPIELGRALNPGDQPISSYTEEDGSRVTRLVIANTMDSEVSQRHALVTPTPDGGVLVSKISYMKSLTVKDWGEVFSQEDKSFDLEQQLTLKFGKSLVEVDISRPRQDIDTLEEEARPPGLADPPSRFPPIGGGPTLQALGWFDSAFDLLTQASSTADLYQSAAQAAADCLGVERGLVLVGRDGQVQVRCCHPTHAEQQPFHRGVVSRAYQHRKAAFTWTADDGLAIAAPILSPAGDVEGALYAGGSGELGSARTRAALLQLLARGVASCLARFLPEPMEQREMTLLTQYLSEGQARDLLRTTEWEEGMVVSVTVLFADIRDFTSITARIGDAGVTMGWSREVLGLLLRCIREHKGTLIDFTGDGLFALWGAPTPQPDHATLACLAAQSVLGGLAAINDVWLGKVGQATRVGMGLNTGQARVGNIGTKEMPKFGAQGPVVNLGSRIEGACKFFRAQALMHNQTYQVLTTKASVRKLGRVCPVGVDPKDAFDIYELGAPSPDGWAEWRDVYERALKVYDHGTREHVAEEAWKLAEWRKKHPEDLPALVLLRRMIELNLNNGKRPDGHPTWMLQEK